jgi:squalene-hopene/tetraprenyl-beta-curcumene cyclase
MTLDPAATPTPEAAARALQRAAARLLEIQDDAGWWKGELQTNVTMDAEDLLMREFLGIRNDVTTAQTAAWIRSQQLADGSWNIYYGGPPNLSTTVEAYVALRVAGDPTEAEHMKRAAEQIRAMGGVERTRVFTRIWLSLVGLWSWRDIPALPPELIFLPPWVPLNIYDFGCWARQTIVPLTIVAALRPVRPLPFDVDELRAGAPPAVREPLTTWGGRFQLLDRILRRYERRPWRGLRRHAMKLAAEWIIRRQEADGCWGGIQPPWVYSVMALHLLGYPLDHPVLKQGIQGLEGFAIVEGDLRRFEACQSPVWDTALAMVALRDAGLPKDHPALLRAAESGRTSRPAAGPSSSTTTTIPTSTTPRKWSWRSTAWPTRAPRTSRPRSSARPTGSGECSAATARGPHSMWTTRRCSYESCPSATSAR